MSKYFTPQQLEYIVMTLMGGYDSPYEPLPEPLQEFDNMGKVLDELVDNVIDDIASEPIDTIYHTFKSDSISARFDKLERNFKPISKG